VTKTQVVSLIFVGLFVVLALNSQIPVTPPTALTVTVDGAAVSGITTLNLTSGNGVLWTCTPAPCSGTNGVLNIAAAVNTAMILSKPTFQSGVCDFVPSSNGTSAYTYTGFGAAGCQALTAYTKGMHLRLVPDVTNAAGACSLNIDSASGLSGNVGPVNIKDKTGKNDPAASLLVPGQEYPIWFDGTVFRLE
jgi:hypothetical protein